MKDIISIIHEDDDVTIVYYDLEKDTQHEAFVTYEQLAEFADTKGYLDQIDDELTPFGEHRQTSTRVPVEHWIDCDFGFKEAEELLTYLKL